MSENKETNAFITAHDRLIRPFIPCSVTAQVRAPQRCRVTKHSGRRYTPNSAFGAICVGWFFATQFLASRAAEVRFPRHPFRVFPAHRFGFPSPSFSVLCATVSSVPRATGFGLPRHRFRVPEQIRADLSTSGLLKSCTVAALSIGKTMMEGLCTVFFPST